MTDSKHYQTSNPFESYEQHSARQNKDNTTPTHVAARSVTDGATYKPGEVIALKGSPSGVVFVSDSGNSQLGTGLKFDSGKEPVERGFLDYFPDAILATAAVSAYGIRKYAVAYRDKGWRTVPDAIGRYKDARGRHILNESVEGPYDSDAEKNGANVLHAAQVAWNAFAYLQLLIEDMKSKGTYVR